MSWLLAARQLLMCRAGWRYAPRPPWGGGCDSEMQGRCGASPSLGPESGRARLPAAAWLHGALHGPIAPPAKLGRLQISAPGPALPLSRQWVCGGPWPRCVAVGIPGVSCLPLIGGWEQTWGKAGRPSQPARDPSVQADGSGHRASPNPGHRGTGRGTWQGVTCGRAWREHDVWQGLVCGRAWRVTGCGMWQSWRERGM